MSLINRPDGIQFVIQAYRERLPVGKRAVMVRRIRELSEQHGVYVSLWSYNAQALEVVFSKELGYLLGETLWNYFNRPAYLVFCERLSKDSNQVLLVVVRDNEVYIDTIVENDKLRNELLPLMTMSESFRVITCGDVSLSKTELPGYFVLPDSLVSSFEVEKEPVFKRLPVLASCRMLSLSLALKSPLLGARLSSTTIAVATLSVLLGVAWIYLLYPPKSTVTAEKVAMKKEDSAYIDFYTALSTPAPRQQLEELVKAAEVLSELIGWQAATINYEGDQYRVQLTRQEGGVEWLTQWASQHHYALSLSPKGAEIAIPSNLIKRPRPAVLYYLQPLMASLIDQLDRLFPSHAVTLGEARAFGLTKSRSMTLNLTDASPDILGLVASTLGENLPLSITAINVNVRAGLLLSGSIQLSVWGM